ncbi:MAG: glycosyltransferase family 4 protein [Nitrospinota bacterium]|nr:glycosyltransferase family 4 protein [Nitrospinota bacterium]
MTDPFGVALTVYLLSRGNAFIQDINRKAIPITLPLLFKLFKTYIAALFKKRSFLNRKLEEIKKYIKTLEFNSSIKTLNLTYQPLYLRTDCVVDLKSGGSVGHTAGILNHLPCFTRPPLFLTSIHIPTVKESIEMQLIPPSRRFMDFREIMYLDYNDHLRKTTKALSEGRSFAFIYQRYSINNYFGFMLAQELNIPFILEYNGSEIWVNKNWSQPLKYEFIAEQIEILNLRGADVVVVVSQTLRDQLIERGIDSDKILTNPNGVDPETYSPGIDGSDIRLKYNLENKTIIGFIGTYEKWHGAEILAQAFGLLIQKHPWYRDHTRLLMIGNGPTMPQVERELTAYGITQECILTGIVPQEEGPAHMAACDILASPHVPNPDGTPFFGSPTKLFEYMAMGKGIVASDLDQIGEVLEHDHTAWLVTPGSAESLMHGLKFMIDNPDIGKRMGEAARKEVISKYTWKEHTRKIIEKLKERCHCD